MCSTFYDHLPKPENGNGRRIMEASREARLSSQEEFILSVILENPFIEDSWVIPAGIIDEVKRLAKTYPRQLIC